MERIKNYLAACVQIEFENMDCRDNGETKAKAIADRDKAIFEMSGLECIVAKEFVIAILGTDNPDIVGLV